MSLPLRQAEEYADRLNDHIKAVQQAMTSLGGFAPQQIASHDLSKWEPCEFEPYARKFISGYETLLTPKQVEVDFSHAWLHHLQRNPHHWQSWILPCQEILPMPATYAREMVADWMGASIVYAGTADMREWLIDNTQRIILHPTTADIVINLLTIRGYEDLFPELEFGTYHYGQ